MRVPVGTVVGLAESVPEGEPELELRKAFPTVQFAELNEPNQKVCFRDVRARVRRVSHVVQVLLARGTQGGRGNAYFMSGTNRSPRESTMGKEPVTVTALLELKVCCRFRSAIWVVLCARAQQWLISVCVQLLAHVGLVGMPNAGKSSLLYSVSSSNPRVASYPFTTLHPSVGNALFNDGTQVSVCDIPVRMSCCVFLWFCV